MMTFAWTLENAILSRPVDARTLAYTLALCGHMLVLQWGYVMRRWFDWELPEPFTLDPPERRKRG